MDFAIGLVKHVVNLPIIVANPDLQIRGRRRGRSPKYIPKSATVSEELLLIKSFLGLVKMTRASTC